MKKLLCFVLVLVSLSAFAQEGHIQSYPRYPGSFSDPLLFLEVEKGTRSFRLSLQAFKDSSGVSTATQTALNGKQSSLKIYNAKDYGFISDGVTDNTATLATMLTAIGSNATIFFPYGTYVLNDAYMSLSNVTFQGENGTVILTTGRKAIQLGNVTGVTFRNITFQSSLNNNTVDYFGLVYSYHRVVSNLMFDNCNFTAPSCVTNGLKFVTDSVGSTVSGVKIINCSFYSIGRMAIETQNNVSDGIKKVWDITVSKCSFKDLGLITASQGDHYGQAVSISGQSSSILLNDLIIENPYDIGIEVTGISNAIYVNNIYFRRVIRNTSLLGFTGNPIEDATIKNVFCDTITTDAKIFLGRVNDSYIENINADLGFVTAGNGYVELRGCERTILKNCSFKPRGIYGILFSVDGTATKPAINNIVESCLVDCNNSSNATFSSTIRFDGIGVTANVIKGGLLKRSSPAAGSRIAQANSATGNYFQGVSFDGSTFSEAQQSITTTASQTSTSVNEEVAQFRNLRINAGTGLANGHQLFLPAIERWYYIQNTTGFSIDVRPASGAAGVVVGPYERKALALRPASNDAIPLFTSGIYSRTAVADAAYTLLATDYLVAYTSLTLSRAVTIPAASGVPGQHFVIKDESGTGATNNITIIGTIDGVVNPTVINRNNDVYSFYSDGTAYHAEVNHSALNTTYGQLGAANTWTANNTFSGILTSNSATVAAVLGRFGAGSGTYDWEFQNGGSPVTRVQLRGYNGGAETIRFDPSSFSYLNTASNLAVGSASDNGARLQDGGSLSLGTSVQSGATVTLDATATNWVNTGAATTWTMPALAAHTGWTYHIYNRGSGAITLSRAGTDNLYKAGSVTTTTIAAGTGAIVFNDGSFWIVTLTN